MGRVIQDRGAPVLLDSEAERPIIAHLVGGPFAGREVALYRARRWFSPRVRRGYVRRTLHLSRRYAWYELGRVWSDHEVLHGEYSFVNVRSDRASMSDDA